MKGFARVVNAIDGSDAFTVDLEAETIFVPGTAHLWQFDIDAYEKTVLLEGLDEIGQTVKYRSQIAQWEARSAQTKPFLQALRLDGRWD